VDLGADVSLPAPSQAGSSVVISPDGTRLVYASGTPPRLFVRRLDQPNAVELPGTQGAASPFFSPDGQWVGFATARGASKISVEGGAVVPVGDAAVRGASWDADGSLVAGVGRELRRIATTGVSQALAAIDDGELGLYQPQVLPGGRAILFTADNPGGVDRTIIQVLTLADGRKKTVIRGGASARYLATANGAGHLVYVNKTTLFAVPFDLTTLDTRGAAVPIVDDLAYDNTTGVGQFDVSGTGTLIHRRASGRGESGQKILQWVDSAGRREPLPAAPSNYLSPRVSPDGARVALWTIGQQGDQDVWTYDPKRDAMTRLTFGEVNTRPIWSPDGRYVVFSRAGSGVFQVRADGARQPQALVASKVVLYPWSFTPDGRRLAYSVVTGASQIWTVPLEDRGGELSAGTPEPFLRSEFSDTTPAFSPDGRWLAYHSNESGTNEVYVRPFPPPASGQGSRWQVSNNGGSSPRWSRSGRELIYQAGDQLMAVSYTVSGDAFVADKPRVWIAALGTSSSLPGGWDLAPDGKRVLVVAPVDSADATKAEHHVVLVQNFFDELRRKVPLGK
jgi:Tol biopolymer transport system component